MNILADCDKGKSLLYISSNFGLSKSTICTIKKQKAQILASTTSSAKRFTMKTGEFVKMEDALWFLTQRKCHIPVGAMQLKCKARELHKKLYNNTFFASDGWLTKFKKRYGIRLLKESGEKLSSSKELVAPFIKELSSVTEKHNLSHEAVFNADESGLYWKMLPDKTYVHSEEKCAPGRKVSKERITFLVCANAEGTKRIEPFVIGKAQNPRSFRNKILPVKYDSSKSAWMNAAIFKKCFFGIFAPEVC
ncbi:tigger transposable element-derived protein 7-like [Rhagoletis pomonella]|uniref:tigger transposable element-derived protein 7-like n=1 Tax=Rhagoletis pomonella TaxID=28610 RepID=UPI001780F316|nr:tigger transposable element-derived protein 7-like [Rhagoletis pomonella]